MKTSELTDAAMTWVLLRLEHPDEYFSVIRNEGKIEIWADDDVGTSHPTLDRDGKPRFVRAADGTRVSLFGCPVDMLNWGRCGPIIERENIAIYRAVGRGWCATNSRWDSFKKSEWAGPTPLIAAMRCFVAIELGDEVDVPKELLP